MPKFPAMNKKSNSSDNPHRATNGKGSMRSKSTIMRLNMYKRGNPVRNKDGKVIGGTLLMGTKSGGHDLPNVARIAPDRRWFGNTRTISQNDLEKFRDEMTVKEADPYSVLLRRQKIPMALLKDSEKVSKYNILETESYADVFGSKTARKRPKLDGNVADYVTLMQSASERIQTYDENPNPDSNIELEPTRERDLRKEDMFAKGQSKRIWGELYKVLDCSDVVLQIVDARNVPGTRCKHIENHIKKNASHKHLVIVINKCDLVPSWVTRKWVKILSADFPTLAFHASITNSFGKGALISLLRQFGKLHADKRQISVGVIGYPNSGKSSVINALVGKKCCKAAPVPGETKVWQYIALMKRIFLIDCPGVVYDVGDDEVETVLKCVVRAERLSNPTDFIAAILSRVKKDYLQRHYQLAEWTDEIDFLSQIASHKGKLLKGGEPDVNQVAVTVINDWQRGKLPFFIPPPRDEDEEEGGDDQPLQLTEGAEEDAGGDEDDDGAASDVGGDALAAEEEDGEDEENDDDEDDFDDEFEDVEDEDDEQPILPTAAAKKGGNVLTGRGAKKAVAQPALGLGAKKIGSGKRGRSWDDL